MLTLGATRFSSVGTSVDATTPIRGATAELESFLAEDRVLRLSVSGRFDTIGRTPDTGLGTAPAVLALPCATLAEISVS